MLIILFLIELIISMIKLYFKKYTEVYLWNFTTVSWAGALNFVSLIYFMYSNEFCFIVNKEILFVNNIKMKYH